MTTCGVHTFGVWDRAFAAARDWGFFKPVPEQPRRWAYRTVASTGEMWGLRFRSPRPRRWSPKFKHNGRTLSATGRGRVRIDGGRGCRFSAKLPFTRRLPRACP